MFANMSFHFNHPNPLDQEGTSRVSSRGLWLWKQTTAGSQR